MTTPTPTPTPTTRAIELQQAGRCGNLWTADGEGCTRAARHSGSHDSTTWRGHVTSTEITLTVTLDCDLEAFRAEYAQPELTWDDLRDYLKADLDGAIGALSYATAIRHRRSVVA